MFALHIIIICFLTGINSANILLEVILIGCSIGAYFMMKKQEDRYIKSVQSHWVIIKSSQDGTIEI